MFGIDLLIFFIFYCFTFHAFLRHTVLALFRLFIKANELDKERKKEKEQKEEEEEKKSLLRELLEGGLGANACLVCVQPAAQTAVQP